LFEILGLVPYFLIRLINLIKIKCIPL